MFATIDKTALRQGDICALPYFPLWRLDQVTSLSGGKSDGSILLPNWDQPIRNHAGTLVLVCTQCCDLENPARRTAVTVAPLLKIPAGPHEGRYSDILASATPRSEGGTDEWTYIQLFPFPAVPDAGINSPVVADLSAMSSLGRAQQAVDLLLSEKVAELDDGTRAQLRRKLAALFGRPDNAAAAEPGQVMPEASNLDQPDVSRGMSVNGDSVGRSAGSSAG